MSTETTPARTVTIVQHAAEIYRDAVEARNLWMGEDDPGIQLFRGEVVENDSPGSGRPDDASIPPFMALEGDLVLRKVLGLADARADGAQLAFLGRELVGHQATLRFAVNGHEVLRPPSPIAASPMT